MRRIRNASAAITLCVLLGGSLWGCASTPEHESTGQYVDDSAITTKVKTQLFADSLTNGLNIHVETNQGVVSLSGFVSTEQQKQQAGKIAANVAGVRSVRNGIVVR